jgi:hypothetical protein
LTNKTIDDITEVEATMSKEPEKTRPDWARQAADDTWTILRAKRLAERLFGDHWPEGALVAITLAIREAEQRAFEASSETSHVWHSVSPRPVTKAYHLVVNPGDHIPAERKAVLVWLRGSHLPFCGYIRYAAGDQACPYFVVYHGNQEIGHDVVAWCDCLPDTGPDFPTAKMYSEQQATGRGFPEREGV